MSRQCLGEKKKRLCEQIAGREYTMCLVRGGTTHGQAQCWFVDDDGDPNNYDYVNYLRGEGPTPRVRKGQFVAKR